MDSATTLAGLEDFDWESGGRDQGEEKADGDGLEKHCDGRKLSVSCVCELCDCVVVCGLIMMRISGRMGSTYSHFLARVRALPVDTLGMGRDAYLEYIVHEGDINTW